MNIWMRRGIALLEIGGGVVGIVAITPIFLQSNSLKITLGIVAIAYYLFGIVAGLLLAESNPKGIAWSKVYQLIQVPLVVSPFFGYTVASGAYVCLIVGTIGIDIRGFFGSSISLSLLHIGSSWAVGLNFVGLVAYLLLRKFGRNRGQVL